jgi:hypothetical protein
MRPHHDLAGVGIGAQPVHSPELDAISSLEYCRVKTTIANLCSSHLNDVRVPLNVLVVTTTEYIQHGFQQHRGQLVNFGREIVQGPSFYLPVPVQWTDVPRILDPKGDAATRFAPDGVDHGYPSLDYCTRTAAFPTTIDIVPAADYEITAFDGHRIAIHNEHGFF